MSFRLKIVLALLVIQIMLMVILIWSSLNFLRISNEVELSNRASSTASILASTLGTEVEIGDREGLMARINDVLAQPDIIYIRVVGQEGVLAAAGDPAVLARPFEEDFLFEDVTDGIYDVSSEIREEGVLLGRVELGISTAGIADIMAAARREMATIALLGLGASLIFSILLGNYFARQLTRLKDATRRIASGDIGYQLVVTGHDELAQTANAFNTMSRKLAMMYSDKQSALNRARQKADELRHSERHIHAVLDNAMDAIFTFDENGTIDRFNPAAERIFGRGADQCIGESLELLIPEPWLSGCLEEMRKFLRSDDAKVFDATREIEGLRSDGSTFPMEIDISEVRIEDRCLFIAIARDVTQRRKAEADLRKAQEAALESSRNKFEFIANVSQEIRAPLNDMLASLNVLADSDLPPDHRSRVTSIQSSGDALVTVINDMLDFSRIEAGKLELETIDFNLWRTVDTVYRMFRESAEAKGVDLVYILPSSLPMTLRGDPTRLRQLLTNLFDNALKFTDRGEIVMRAELVETGEDHVVLRFEVEDTGIGIAAGTQQRIFEMFSRDDSPLASSGYRSSGLGLMISRRLAEMMHGSIGVSSEPGHGSNFWFTARFNNPAVIDQDVGEFPEDLSHLRVLVVNPDSKVCESLQVILSGFGAHTLCIEDSTRALSELCTAAGRGRPYDLVIFDRILSGMSGLQFAHAVRGDHRIADTRMIMLAATGYRGEGEEVRQAGIQGYLTAPVESEQLYEAILAVMQARRDSRRDFVTRHSLDILQRQPHALVVSDDPPRQKRLLGRLERLGYRAGFATDAGEALETLGKCRCSLILVDNETQELLGTDEIRLLSAGEAGHVPTVVIVSPGIDSEQCRIYEAAGADQCYTGIDSLEASGGESIVPPLRQSVT